MEMIAKIFLCGIGLLFFAALIFLVFTLPLVETPAVINEINQSEAANVETGVE